MSNTCNQQYRLCYALYRWVCQKTGRFPGLLEYPKVPKTMNLQNRYTYLDESGWPIIRQKMACFCESATRNRCFQGFIPAPITFIIDLSITLHMTLIVLDTVERLGRVPQYYSIRFALPYNDDVHITPARRIFTSNTGGHTIYRKEVARSKVSSLKQRFGGRMSPGLDVYHILSQSLLRTCRSCGRRRRHGLATQWPG